MTIPQWPDTLPPPLVEGLREKLPDTVLRTQMDQGPAKLRQRNSAGVARLNVAYLLDREQMAALRSFYLGTLSGGAQRFAYVHPMTGDSVTCRFVQPPEAAPLNGAFFRAALVLEVLP